MFMSLEHKLQAAHEFQLQRPFFRPKVRVALPTDGTADEHLLTLKWQEMVLSQQHVLNADEFSLCLRLTQERDLAANLSLSMVHAARRESAIFNQMDEVYSLGNRTVERGAKRGRLNLVVKSRWNVKDRKDAAKAAGRYFDDVGEIHIYGQAPTNLQTVTSLATAGVLPYSSQSYIHERLHAAQYNLVEGKKPPQELAEAQAYRAGQDDRRLYPHEAMVSDITSLALYENLDPVKYNAAVWVIDRLNALGLKQFQIIQLIADPGQWNDTLGNWEGLETAIGEEMIKKSVTEEDLEREVMADKLRHAIAMQQARLAAQTVLYKEFKDEVDQARTDKKTFKTRQEQERINYLRQKQELVSTPTLV